MPSVCVGERPPLWRGFVTRCLSEDRACEHLWSHWYTQDSQVLAGCQRVLCAHRQLHQGLPV